MAIITPPALLRFLHRASDISLGYSELNFYGPGNIPDAQIGYAGDAEGAWKKEWIVFATDALGDPLFIDAGSAALPVLTAPHGEDSWDPSPVADSLEQLEGILEKLRALATGRETPVALEQNPLPAEIVAALLDEIAAANPASEAWYWMDFLQQED